MGDKLSYQECCEFVLCSGEKMGPSEPIRLKLSCRIRIKYKEAV